MSEQPFPPSGSAPAPAYAAPTAAYPATAPQYSTQPVAIRRPDTLAALLLLLAGIAAGVSLLLTWLPGVKLTGWELVRRGFSTLIHHPSQVFSDGWWQPLAVVLGGGALFVIGLLLLIPARSHRFLGLLALLISLGAGAGVLVPLRDAGWHLDRFAVGFWFACAVGVLGVLGSLKALLSRRRYATTAPTEG